MDYKTCTRCGSELPNTKEYFYGQLVKCKTKPDYYKLSPWCKECQKENTKKNIDKDREGFYQKQKPYQIKNRRVRSGWRKAWSDRNPERNYESQANWRRDNPEKCREHAQKHRNHDITSTEEKAVLKIFDYSCVYCGMTLEEHKKIHKQKLHNDHVDDEGYNDLRNDVPACRSCNSSKHTSTLDEWYSLQKFYDEIKYNKIIWWITEGYKDYIEDKPPYRIFKKKNDGKTTFHWELWTVDEMRNTVECIASRPKKKDLKIDIAEFLKTP